MLTEGLVVVLGVARQAEQRGSHLLAALVQLLQTPGGGRERSRRRSVRELLGFELHLEELGVALAGGGAVVVLQELSQQGHALLHFLDGVHPLSHLLCPLLVLHTPPEP